MSETGKKQELLQKLKALSEQGVGGEKMNAQRKLAALMKKYGISEDDLQTNQKNEYRFTYKTETESILLLQTIYKVTNDTQIYSYKYKSNGKKVKNTIGCFCTTEQRIEIDFLFDFYKKTFQKDFELFLRAFIQKHRIFGERIDNDDDEKTEEMDRSSLFRMAAMMDGMSDDQPLRQITDKK